MTWLLGYGLAIVIGVSLGLLGGGGSVLALPVLVYVMDIDPKSAIAMTLIIVGIVSLLGTVPHARKGNVNLKTAVVFGSATMVGAYLGARIATLPFVTSGFQMILFGLAMLSAAVLMIYRTTQTKAEPNQELDQVTYIKPTCKYCWLWLMTEGLGVGVLTGLVGVGGGFAIVPALVLLGKIPMKQAIGTSLLIIACNSIAGLLGYLGHVVIDWQITVGFTFLAAVGTILGSYLTQFVSTQQLQKAFGYFLLIVASFVLIQNRASFQPSRDRAEESPTNHQIAMENRL
ncbi:MAG: sulfite exporter TauE/SafE family protein [Synechococcaceae cyanobacterium RL_1_2]|nr:sulfite exporter TauE/SafE family protein [Synechococcaceae cyanobacterium RL_1_2]